MKIDCITTYNPRDPSSWPARHLGLYRASTDIMAALSDKGVRLGQLGPLERKRRPINRLKWLWHKKLFNKDFYSWADPQVGYHYAQQLQYRARGSDADLQLCLENAIPLAQHITHKPLVLWTDAPLGALVNFYPYLSNLPAETRLEIWMMEDNVFKRCDRLIFINQWAAEQACKIYGVSEKKIQVIPRTTRLPAGVKPAEVVAAIRKRDAVKCNLLFVGVDWARKGGDRALAIAEAVRLRGFSVRLHLVGARPPGATPDYVSAHGYVDRSTEQGKRLMQSLYKASHFLLHPTEADVFGVATNEAACFGVPVVARGVGGISTHSIRPALGKVFPPEALPGEYASYITEQMSLPSRYQRLAISTHQLSRLATPSVMARTAIAVLKQTVEEKGAIPYSNY